MRNRATSSFLNLIVVLGLFVINAWSQPSTALVGAADGAEVLENDFAFFSQNDESDIEGRDLVSGGGNIDPISYCAPAYSTKIKPCAQRIKFCRPYGARMKFTGKGCRK